MPPAAVNKNSGALGTQRPTSVIGSPSAVSAGQSTAGLRTDHSFTLSGSPSDDGSSLPHSSPPSPEKNDADPNKHDKTKRETQSKSDSASKSALAVPTEGSPPVDTDGFRALLLRLARTFGTETAHICGRKTRDFACNILKICAIAAAGAHTRRMKDTDDHTTCAAQDAQVFLSSAMLSVAKCCIQNP